MTSKEIDDLITLITENLEADCELTEDEDGKHFSSWTETGKAYEALQEAYPDLAIEKIEKILEVIKDRVEIKWDRSREETGHVDWISYDLDKKADEMIEEILNT